MMIDLKEIFDETQNKLMEISSDFPWENKEAYMSWLVQTYEYAYNSTRILALTGGKMPEDKTIFSNRFIAHASEEKGHEKLLEKDVSYLGYDIKKIEPCSEARAFHQSLYYWIFCGNPVGMFGWVLALEGFAVRNVPQIYEVCRSCYGNRGVNFLRVHAEEDEDHLGSAFKTISSLTDEEGGIVAQALIQYSELYGGMLQKIKKDCRIFRRVAA